MASEIRYPGTLDRLHAVNMNGHGGIFVEVATDALGGQFPDEVLAVVYEVDQQGDPVEPGGDSISKATELDDDGNGIFSKCPIPKTTCVLKFHKVKAWERRGTGGYDLIGTVLFEVEDCSGLCPPIPIPPPPRQDG